MCESADSCDEKSIVPIVDDQQPDDVDCNNVCVDDLLPDSVVSVDDVKSDRECSADDVVML